jgi:hypothetical protein
LNCFESGFSQENVTNAIRNLCEDNYGKQVWTAISNKEAKVDELAPILLEVSLDATPILPSLVPFREKSKDGEVDKVCIRVAGSCGKEETLTQKHQCFQDSVEVKTPEDLKELMDNCRVATHCFLLIFGCEILPR